MTTILSEDFNRVVANQWTGGTFAWTLTLAAGGSNPADWDINGTKGLQTHAAVNELHYSTANVGTPNHKVRTTINLSVADVTGATATSIVLLRYTDVSNYYAAFLTWTTAEVVQIQLYKRVAGALTAFGSAVTVATHTGAANLQVSVEAYVQGSNLYAKAWPAADPEPSTWTVEATDTALTTGNFAGLGSRRETGNTNASLAFAFDSFTAAAVALTATEQDVYPPRVLLTVTDLSLGDTVQLYRVVGGDRTAVRAGADNAVDDPSFVRIDAELPFGVPVSYVAVVNDDFEFSTSSVTYALPGGKVVVSDAITGNAVEVVILAWPDKTYERRAAVYRVGGRNVAVVGDYGMFTGDIEFYTELTSTRDELVDLFASATEGVIQIRQPGGYDGIDSYVAVLGVTERRFSPDGSDQRRTHLVRAAETEGWAPALEATGYTLQDIADAYDGLTLADLAGDFDTLLEVAQGDFSA
jgi:hypothetical protein